MKRALVYPSHMSSGFGHVSRCLALADELSRKGWAVALVLSGPHAEAVRQAGHRVFEPWFPARPHQRRIESPAYTCILDGNIQVLRDGFVRPWRVYAAAIEAVRIVQHFRPDVLIGDDSLLVWSLGQHLGLPVVQIVQSFMHPAGPGIIWWQDPPSGMISPNIQPVLAPLLRRWNLDPVNRAEELLRGDLYLVPSLPELDPLPDGLANVHYVGALTRPSAQADVLLVPFNHRDGKPVIYVTLGGGAGLVGSHHFLKTVDQAFQDAPWKVIVSTGRRFDPAKLSPASPNLFYYQWVPGSIVIQHSDMVIFHGVHNTMMEVVQHGVPSVVLPFHSEQESNGRRLEACSAGRVLSPVASTDSMQLVRSRWRYGEFATWVQPVSPLTPEVLRTCVASVLQDPHLGEGAKALSAIAAQYRGAPAAVELIRQLG